MDIASIANFGTASRLAASATEPSGRLPRSAEARRGTDGIDVVEVSPQARKAAADIRSDLVDRVKLEIHSGTYENLKKLDAAIERMMSDLRE